MKIIHFILLLLGFLLPQQSVFATDDLITDQLLSYHNTYYIDYKGMKAGKLTLHSLIDQNSQNYRLTAKVTPSFLVKMFGVSEMKGISIGNIHDDFFVLTSNEWIGTKNEKLLTIQTHDHQAKVNQKKQKKSYAIDSNAQEPLTMIAYLGWSLQHDKLPKVAHLILKKGQQSYQVIKQSNYQLMLVEKPNKKRVITLIYDENFQLKSLLKTKKGKVDIHVWR